MSPPLAALLHLITADEAISPSAPEGVISNLNHQLCLAVCVSRHVYVASPTEKPQAVCLPPETSPQSPGQLPPQSPGQLPPQSPAQLPPQSPGQLPRIRATSRKDAGSSRRSKRHPKDSPAALLTNKTGGGELDDQARDSLRWEGVLEDPQAEEKRLELYRANRRQRYISHRDALIKDTLRQTFPKESKEERGFD